MTLGALLMAAAGCLVGCGAGLDDCAQASNHLAACLATAAPDGGSDGGAAPVGCSGGALCSAACVNGASCDVIKDAFSGAPTVKSKPFFDCNSACVPTR
jgi:hypothetical protein